MEQFQARSSHLFLEEEEEDMSIMKSNLHSTNLESSSSIGLFNVSSKIQQLLCPLEVMKSDVECVVVEFLELEEGTITNIKRDNLSSDRRRRGGPSNLDSIGTRYGSGFASSKLDYGIRGVDRDVGGSSSIQLPSYPFSPNYLPAHPKPFLTNRNLEVHDLRNHSHYSIAWSLKNCMNYTTSESGDIALDVKM